MTNQPSLNWLNADVERVKVLPGPEGLTLERIMVGRYGEVPEHWPHSTDFPRGASAGGPTMFAASYSLNEKSDVWADNAAALYEQAIRERWTVAARRWGLQTAMAKEYGVSQSTIGLIVRRVLRS